MEFIIKNRDGETMHTVQAETLKSAVEKSYADLRSADLRYANLSSANLSFSKVNWQSHSMISEIIRQWAGDDIKKRMVAGLIAISIYW